VNFNGFIREELAISSQIIGMVISNPFQKMKEMI